MALRTGHSSEGFTADQLRRTAPGGCPMTQRMRLQLSPVLAIARLLVTLTLFGLALVDGHKWLP